MNIRATLALVLIAAGLGLYVYLAELRGERQRQGAESVAKRLLTLEVDQITALEVPLEGGGRAKLVRSGDAGAEDWQLEAPLEFAADAGFVSHLVSSLSRLESEAVIEDPPQDLAPFGLGEGRRPVRVWTGEGEPTVLYLGGAAPLGSALYVALEGQGEKLFTVAQRDAGALEPRLLDLRDRSLVSFQADEVKRLRVSEFGRLVALVERVEPEQEEKNGDWQMLEPGHDRADGERVRRLLQDLALAQATDFVDEPGPLEEYGLDSPELELIVETEQSTQRLRIGRVQDQGYVRVNDGSLVYQTSDRVLLNVPRKPFAYRYKRVLELDITAVRRIELDFPRDSAAHSFVREDSKWVPEDAEAQVKSLSVEDVLYALEDLQATSVVEGSSDRAALGLDPPRVRVSVFDASRAELGWLELGDPELNAGMGARSSANDRLWRVDNDVGVDIPLSLEAFRTNFLEEAEEEPEPEALDTES